MRTHGTLTKWNDDRGFGFIAPAGAGAEIFVHVSAFPRDGRRPNVGEVVSFDIETGEDGRKRAIRVLRPGSRSGPHADKGAAPIRVPLAATLGVLIVGALGGYAYRTSTLAQPDHLRQVAQPPPDDRAIADRFACDGRTRCAQMTSCDEAVYFLQHCPGVQMDGDHDGTPCEQQWCGN
jgi:cold shock CspA family protein